jgi:hypothetical protein
MMSAWQRQDEEIQKRVGKIQSEIIKEEIK